VDSVGGGAASSPAGDAGAASSPAGDAGAASSPASDAGTASSPAGGADAYANASHMAVYSMFVQSLSPGSRTAFLLRQLEDASAAARDACYEVGTQLGQVAQVAQQHPEVLKHIADRIDWGRLENVFVAALPSLSDTFSADRLSAKELPRRDMPLPNDFFFDVDDFRWFGSVVSKSFTFPFPNSPAGSKVHRVLGVVVTLPMDGFLLVHPGLSGVSLLGLDSTYRHRNKGKPTPPEWLLVDKTVLKTKLPHLRDFATTFFGGSGGGQCYIRQATDEQRVDLHFLKGDLCLVIKFEVTLPTHSQFTPAPRFVAEDGW
jgi:hypothetical protein